MYLYTYIDIHMHTRTHVDRYMLTPANTHARKRNAYVYVCMYAFLRESETERHIVRKRILRFTGSFMQKKESDPAPF